MIRRTIGVMGGFVAANGFGGLIANLILNPLFNARFGAHIRTMEEGLHFPSLLSGYLVLALLVDLQLHRAIPRARTIALGAKAGITVGLATFVAGHLITAGWSKLDPTAMLFSGCFDTVAAVMAGIAIAAIQKSRVEAK